MMRASFRKDLVKNHHFFLDNVSEMIIAVRETVCIESFLVMISMRRASFRKDLVGKVFADCML